MLKYILLLFHRERHAEPLTRACVVNGERVRSPRARNPLEPASHTHADSHAHTRIAHTHTRHSHRRCCRRLNSVPFDPMSVMFVGCRRRRRRCGGSLSEIRPRVISGC